MSGRRRKVQIQPIIFRWFPRHQFHFFNLKQLDAIQNKNWICLEIQKSRASQHNDATFSLSLWLSLTLSRKTIRLGNTSELRIINRSERRKNEGEAKRRKKNYEMIHNKERQWTVVHSRTCPKSSGAIDNLWGLKVARGGRGRLTRNGVVIVLKRWEAGDIKRRVLLSWFVVIPQQPPADFYFHRKKNKNKKMCRRRFLFTQRRPRGRRRRPKVNDGRGRDFLFSQLVLCVCVCVSARTRVTPSSPWEKSCGRMRGEERKKWNNNNNENSHTNDSESSKKQMKAVQKRIVEQREEKKREWKLRLQPPPSRRGEEGKLPWKKKGELNYTFFCFVHFWWNGHTHTRPRDGKPTKWRDQHSPFCKILIWKEFFVSLLEIAGQR